MSTKAKSMTIIMTEDGSVELEEREGFWPVPVGTVLEFGSGLETREVTEVHLRFGHPQERPPMELYLHTKPWYKASE